MLETFDYPGTEIRPCRKRLTKEATSLAFSSTRTGCPGVLSGSAMAALARRSSTLTIPWALPKDEESITQAQSTVTTSAAMVTFTRFSCRAAPSQNTMCPARSGTNLLSINEPGDFTGGFDPDGSGIFQAFVSVRGTITSFSVPEALSTFAYEINNSKHLVVGYYIDGSGITHGYSRDANGALNFPIEPPGSTASVLFGVNNRNWVVGRYADSSGVTHGLFFMTPGDFLTFDYPDSTFTSLNGISSQGLLCGRYVDASGIAHGFLAKVNPNATSEPNRNNLPLAPVNPAHPRLRHCDQGRRPCRSDPS